MRPVLQRIALQGGITALVLAVMGLLISELASIWLEAAPGGRSGAVAVPSADANDSLSNTLRSRIPLMMAGWGFAFVAVGELVLYFWRGRKNSQAVVSPPPDPMDKLLSDLLQPTESPQRATGAVSPPQAGTN
jgi:hypothetical protein